MMKPPDGYEYENRDNVLYIKNITTREQAEEWVQKFSEYSSVIWRVSRTYPHAGKRGTVYCFKKHYRCYHNTRTSKPVIAGKRNTNCPAKMMVHVLQEKKLENHPCHCFVQFQNDHNHAIDLPAFELACAICSNQGNQDSNQCNPAISEGNKQPGMEGSPAEAGDVVEVSCIEQVKECINSLNEMFDVLKTKLLNDPSIMVPAVRTFVSNFKDSYQSSFKFVPGLYTSFLHSTSCIPRSIKNYKRERKTGSRPTAVGKTFSKFSAKKRPLKIPNSSRRPPLALKLHDYAMSGGLPPKKRQRPHTFPDCAVNNEESICSSKPNSQVTSAVSTEVITL